VTAPLQEQPWYDQAECLKADADAFYPEKGRSTVHAAKRICGRCPVQAPCLAWALDRGERYGVWGGKTERERRKIAALRRQVAALGA
jgi:WhiB family transcriptional regulator, redox-sensing transcriptional regulator